MKPGPSAQARRQPNQANRSRFQRQSADPRVQSSPSKYTGCCRKVATIAQILNQLGSGSSQYLVTRLAKARHRSRRVPDGRMTKLVPRLFVQNGTARPRVTRGQGGIEHGRIRVRDPAMKPATRSGEHPRRPGEDAYKWSQLYAAPHRDPFRYN